MTVRRDEPETLGAISLAARERLDNLVFVVNCNLQRLDGPVRGNGKVIQELEAVFRGAGWNVIKVVWGSKWDPLLAQDKDGVLLNKMNNTVDGEFQRYAVEDGGYAREHFFGPDERLRQMVSHLSDDELRNLPRGGHDYRKLYAAYKAATENLGSGAPTVILAKTVKGWTLGEGFEGRNSTHQIKKMTKQQIVDLRDRLHMHDEIPESSIEADDPPYFKPAEDSVEYQYMMERRRALDGSIPKRTTHVRRALSLPDPSAFSEMWGGSGGQEVSTTMAFTRLLRSLTRDEHVGGRIVPIIPDEARTFGMDSLFREIGIYASQGQKYEPVDHDLLLSYSESAKGQILEEGITEAGSMASFIAAGTSYATRGVPMVPFYTFYSMFGFQRVGDLIWQAADIRARGFLMAATAGRTTLMGEGLQHQDGHSLVLASTVPAVQAYDPAFAYEIGAIVRGGHRPHVRRWTRRLDRRLLLHHPVQRELRDAGPARRSRDSTSRSSRASTSSPTHPRSTTRQPATILFSGVTHLPAREAAAELAEHYGVAAELWSVTSYKALREEGLSAERHNRLHPSGEQRTPLVAQRLAESAGPITAVSDFMAIVPDQIRQFVDDRTFTTLGTDGMGRSDTREALRRFFEIDTGHVVVAVLSGLLADGKIEASVVEDALGALRHRRRRRRPLDLLHPLILPRTRPRPNRFSAPLRIGW